MSHPPSQQICLMIDQCGVNSTTYASKTHDYIYKNGNIAVSTIPTPNKEFLHGKSSEFYVIAKIRRTSVHREKTTNIEHTAREVEHLKLKKLKKKFFLIKNKPSLALHKEQEQ